MVDNAVLVHIYIDLLCMSLSWHEIRYRTFHPAPSSVSGIQLLSDDVGARRGQLVPAAGSADDFLDQEGDKGQVRSSTAGWCSRRKWRPGKSPCLEHRTAVCQIINTCWVWTHAKESKIEIVYLQHNYTNFTIIGGVARYKKINKPQTVPNFSFNVLFFT